MSSVAGADRKGRIAARLRLWLDGRSFASGTFWLVAGDAINRGGRFLLLVLLAREVGAASYGGWVVAIATATILANAGDAGLGTVMTRDIAADRGLTRRYLANLWTVVPLLALLGFGLLLVSTPAAPHGASRLVLLVVGAGGVLESSAYLLLSPLRAHGRFRLEALVRAFQGGTLLLIGAAVLLISRGQAEALAPVFPAVAAVAVAIGGIAVWRSFGAVRPQFDVRLLRQLFGSALPVFASTVVFFVYFRVDAYLLAFLVGEEATGLYGAAYNLAFGAAFLPLMLGRTALPRFAACESVAALRSIFLRTAALTAMLAGGLSVLLVAAAPLLPRLYGEGFAGAQSPYLFLILAQALYFFTHLNYVVIIARRRARTAWGLTMLTLSINLAANFILIPRLGATGAALAMIISETALLTAQIPIVRSLIGSSAVDVAAQAKPAAIGPDEERTQRAA